MKMINLLSDRFCHHLGSFLGLLLFIGICLTLVGCSPTRQTITTYRQIDSLVVRDSVVYVDLPVERVVDIVPVYDTLHLSTSVASASAWVDTSYHILRGEIENSDIPIQTVVQYVDHYHVRDSIVTQEVKVEVPVEVVRYPKSYWVFLSLIVAFVIYSVIFIYKKFFL